MNSVLTNQGRNGDWMQTYTGKAFWPFDPRPDEVCIEDIAHALSLLCRYGGHCKHFYSVAQHSIYVSDLCLNRNKLWGLLHDATEAYLVDLPRPIKWHLPEYRAIEERLQIVIAEKFDLCLTMPIEVKRIDNAILACERDQIMAKPPYDWQVDIAFKVEVSINQWSPEHAEREFIKTFRKLTG